ncbi:MULTISPECIES: hypothetical protein [Enterococcus]|nr:hypothetical protein [Enterococcus faecalis]
MKTSSKVLLDQLTTIDYEIRQCLFLETTHEKEKNKQSRLSN